MKVKELIEQLKSFDPELEVKLCDYAEDSDDNLIFDEPQGVELLTEPEGQKRTILALYYNIEAPRNRTFEGDRQIWPVGGFKGMITEAVDKLKTIEYNKYIDRPSTEEIRWRKEEYLNRQRYHQRK